MKKGFELLMAKSVCKKSENTTFEIPSNYRDLQFLFSLGYNTFNNDLFFNEKNDLKLPLTNILYKNQDVEIELDYFYSIDEIKIILESGEKYEDYFTNFKLIKFAHLNYPTNSHLYIKYSDFNFQSIFIGNYPFCVDNNDKFIKLEDNIFDFINNIFEVKNLNLFKENFPSQLYRNWGEDFWRVREDGEQPT